MNGTPAAEGMCPDCGASLPSKANYCWLCGRALPWSLPSPPLVRTGVAKPLDLNTAPRPLALYQFSLSTLLLVMTYAAVLIGTFTAQPGVGLAMAFLTAPAVVRTCYVGMRKKARGERLSWAGKVGVFFASAMLVAVIVAASIGAFFAVCVISLR